MAASISDVRLMEESEWSRPDWCMSAKELLAISAGWVRVRGEGEMWEEDTSGEVGGFTRL